MKCVSKLKCYFFLACGYTDHQQAPIACFSHWTEGKYFTNFSTLRATKKNSSSYQIACNTATFGDRPCTQSVPISPVLSS